jgi:hypothetical protein
MTTTDNTRHPQREICQDKAGPYITEWQCPPPLYREHYQIVASSWSTDGETSLPLQTISLIHVDGCQQCRLDVHRCPGCSEPLHHGQVTCADCTRRF